MAYVVDEYGRKRDYSYLNPTVPGANQIQNQTPTLTASNIAAKQPTLMYGDRDPVTGKTTFGVVGQSTPQTTQPDIEAMIRAMPCFVETEENDYLIQDNSDSDEVIF